MDALLAYAIHKVVSEIHKKPKRGEKMEKRRDITGYRNTTQAVHIGEVVASTLIFVERGGVTIGTVVHIQEKGGWIIKLGDSMYLGLGYGSRLSCLNSAPHSCHFYVNE